MPDPLSTVEAYQTYIYILPERYRSILRSTLVYISSGALFGRLKELQGDAFTLPCWLVFT